MLRLKPLLLILLYISSVLVLSVRLPSLDQISRQELVNNFCGNSSSNIHHTYDHVLLEPKHKLLYCYVPKVACTNWKRILYVLSGLTTNANLGKIPASLVHENGTFLRLNQLNETEIRDILSGLNGYISLIVVRHPFERLLSAFRNKFEGTLPSARYFQERIGKYIIKKFRKNPSNISLDSGSDVTFREFVNYLISDNLNQSKIELINEHWRPINQICQPCLINYSYIIKYEYLIDEAEILLDLIKAKNIDFPQTKISRTNLRLKKYYQQLSLEEIGKLYEFYKMDFQMFGYDLDNILGFDLV